jgi:hypothetical protein
VASLLGKGALKLATAIARHVWCFLHRSSKKLRVGKLVFPMSACRAWCGAGIVAKKKMGVFASFCTPVRGAALPTARQSVRMQRLSDGQGTAPAHLILSCVTLQSRSFPFSCARKQCLALHHPMRVCSCRCHLPRA